jgi:hypothetical protein
MIKPLIGLSMKKIKPPHFVAKVFETILVIGYILFEELIWNVFAKPIFQYFKSLALLDSLKQTFLGMNRYLLLTIFMIIFVITEVMGFFSGYCFVNGYILMGLTVYASKIPIAAFTFWLFDLTKDKLMTFAWLKSAYDYIMGLIKKITQLPVSVYIKAKIKATKVKLKALVVIYFGEEGFRARMKAHYAAFKPYVTTLLKR